MKKNRDFLFDSSCGPFKHQQQTRELLGLTTLKQNLYKREAVLILRSVPILTDEKNLKESIFYLNIIVVTPLQSPLAS